MKGKSIIISIVSVVALLLCVVFGAQGCQNSAIDREEIINQSLEIISTEQTQLFDVLEQMGQSISHGSEQEMQFQTTIAQMLNQPTIIFRWQYKPFTKTLRNGCRLTFTKIWTRQFSDTTKM